MPHRLFDWQVQIKAARREYEVISISLEFFQNATEDEIHELAEARAWDGFLRGEIHNAEWHLDATYLIRMYSVFEMAVGSFWRLLPGNMEHESDGNAKLEEVGYAQAIDLGVIEAAQTVRAHRNRLVHQRIERHARAMTIEKASSDLQTYLSRLPSTWA
jgi:hypothetical protein